MPAFVVACVVFASGCFAAIALRAVWPRMRDGLSGVLAPLAVASAAAALYLHLERGAPQAPAAEAGGTELDALAAQMRRKLGDEAPPAGGARKPAGDLRDLSRTLAEKLERDPSNGPGWALLARSYLNTQQFADADKAFGKAAKLLPPDAQLLADWADAHVMANNRAWDKAGAELVQRALASDAKNLKALALAGTEATDRGDYRKAATYWDRMRAAAAPGSPEAQQAEANLADAKARASGKAPAGAGPVTNSGANGRISGKVELAAPVAAANPDAVVFVFAKDPKGGPPIAAKRFKARELPVTFTLEDGDAMIPGRGLSSAGEVLVSARLSKSGDAVAQPGDIESESITTRAGATPVVLRLSKLR